MKPAQAYKEARWRIEKCKRARSDDGKTNLDLSRLGLTALPPQIGQLTAVTRLRLDHNFLGDLPPELGQLTGLNFLRLDANRLTSLPQEFGSLTALEELYLQDNEFTVWPPHLRNLAHLRVLLLNDNKLTTVPEGIRRLVKLDELHLDYNRLTELPAEIGQLMQLKELHLYSNQLAALPVELRQLAALTALYLHDNPLLGVPLEILGPHPREIALGMARPRPPREILEAYFRIAGEGGLPLGECKLIVVGRGGAGKTSLIKRLGGKGYDPDEPETHGITIQKLRFDGELGPVTARVWDFGGQVVLHSMHEFFLTARSLYLLVLGERDDMLERDAAYWLQLIRSYAGRAPVVVVLNKSAGRERAFDRETLERKYGPILGWVATECSVAEDGPAGIAALREHITAALDSEHMETVRRKFPRKWVEIKEELEEMPESFLDYQAYEEKCRARGERDPKEQTALAGDLHDLGIALNYGRDPRLRETTVLRPDWLANGIYAVLRANDLDKALPAELNVPLAPEGVITAEALVRIHRKAEAWKMLRAEDYPEEKREFLLRLMDRFHLSYPLDDQGREQLVPTLLPPNPPPGTEEPEGAERVRLRYEFDVVPAPLLPWFIARNFSLVPQRRHWRRGTMLAFGEARARVWATQDERYVFATAAGAQKHERDRLLAVIRGTLRKMFNDYQALHPVEQWEHKGQWVPIETLVELGALPRELLPRSAEAEGFAAEEEEDER